jgi:sulfatase maturation enzyme AslB (radical SAM superfamily)
MKFITKSKDQYDNPDKKLKGRACQVPFRHIEIHQSGLVSACCYTWLPTWTGDLLTDSVDEIINNVERKRITDGMRRSDFSDCNDQCPDLNNLLHGKKQHRIVPKLMLDFSLMLTPYTVYFCYDPSCNLQCPSCRDNLIVLDPTNPLDETGAKAKIIHEKTKELVNTLLNNKRKVVINITGSGDPFASPLYWDYLLELASKPVSKNLLIELQTNGVLMTEKRLEMIKPLWKHIKYVNVSVDAATDETYKVVRKNGNFAKLKNNLDYFDSLVQNKQFASDFHWQTNFIVQRDNFKELKEFVAWQLTYKSKPTIWTNLIAQWHHIDDERFKGIAVWKDDHINKQEFLSILKDPIFLNSQLNLGNLNSFVHKK